jgi:hypothetical protein
MRKKLMPFAAFMMLASGSALADGAYHWTPPKPGQLICNMAFPGSLKVCHPVGTSPAGVIGIGNGMQLVTLAPFSAWEGLVAKENPKIAVFRGKQMVGLLSNANGLPFFQNISHITVSDLPSGDQQVIITAWTGGNNANSNETLALRITRAGHIALHQH